MSTPCIACIGIIGKHDNPLHIALFPPYVPPTPPSIPGLTPKEPSPANPATTLEFSFLLNSSLDIFDARSRDRSRIDQDLGLLQTVDERLAIWGWLTGTGVKFAIIIDAWGKGGGGKVMGGLERSGTGESVESFITGGGSVRGKKGGKGQQAVTDADLRPAFKALQMAWIRLVGNPFFVPDDMVPMKGTQGKGGITSRRFLGEVRRIGEGWRPGLSAL